MKILYISSVPSEKEFFALKDKVRKGVSTTAYGMEEAGIKFHTLIQQGLVADNNTEVLSLVGRTVSFKTHKGLLLGIKKEKKGLIKYKHLAVLNLPVLKQICLAISFFFNTLSWLLKNKNEDEKLILIDAAYVTVIPGVVLVAQILRCKKIGIFADIYEYMGDVVNDQTKRKTLAKIIRKLVSKSYANLDGFVVITEQANSVVNKKGKPYMVLEGLVDIKEIDFEESFSFQEKSPRVIMYAGALREQYGLKALVDGFIAVPGEDLRLEIYGDGDYVPEIIKAAQIDGRIKYLGRVDNKEVVEKERQATLLVNPRPVNEEFTLYSFPSKNMEYMVSGTPVLTTRLPGMPKEYYNYVYTIDGEGTEAVTEALKKMLEKPQEELFKKGEAARQFVLNKKNNVLQAERIKRLLV